MSQRLDTARTGRAALPFDAVPRDLQTHDWWACVHPKTDVVLRRALPVGDHPALSPA
jgi:hypothetical protein